MDERDLINRLVEILDEASYRQSLRRIRHVRVALGGRRALDPERLKRCFADATRSTNAAGAELHIEIEPVTHHCLACGWNFAGTAADSPCPACKHPHTEQVGGEQIRIVDIEADIGADTKSA